MTYKYRVEHTRIIDDILEIEAKPIGWPLRFKPGQYASIGFIKNGRPSVVRCFSLIGNGDGSSVRFGIRLLGDFTHTLSELQEGTELRIKGPFGEFYINDDYDKRVVLLASGIGITPFLSMLQQADIPPTTLLFSNRSALSIPFKQELLSRAQQIKDLELGFFATDDVIEGTGVIQGRIDERYMQRFTSGNYAGSTYFICGSDNFMRRTQDMLSSFGVPSDRIITESFVLDGIESMGANSRARLWTYAFSAAALSIALFGITAMDLIRAVPKLSATQQPVSSQTTTKNTTSTDSNASDSTTSDSQSTNSTNTQSYYQPPVSSVS